MPSNEITWALYGMAIVAAPIVAVWLWRRLGRARKRRDAAIQELVGHADRLGESRVAVAFNYACAPVEDIEAENERLRNRYPLNASEPHKVNPHYAKPAPYAASAKALGSKPEAPWVTREELETAMMALVDDAADRVGDWGAKIERRLDALEANEPEGK